MTGYQLELIRRARRIAEYNIARRRLRAALVESWAIPLVDWVASRMRP